MASVFTMLLAAVAAAAAGLIFVPAPSKTLALAAIVASEKSALVAALALAALALAPFTLRRPGLRLSLAVAVLLALAALGPSLVPLVQARRLARARGLSLDLVRTVCSPIDSDGPGHPDRTVGYATVDGGRVLSLDVYLPQQRPAAPSRPLLIVHGGYWSAGDKGEAPGASRHLADLGFTVFDVEYRTSPQPNWKTATGDVKCAIGWVKRHAATADWNVDPAKVALLGRSAGGHLALMAAYTPTDGALPPTCDADDVSVDAVIALYAPTDLVWGYANPANPRVADSPAKIRAFVGGSPETAPDRFRALSPVERVTATSPQTLLAQGGRDQFLAPTHLDRLAARLQAAGVPHDSLFIPWAQHGFDFVTDGPSSQLWEATLLRFLGVSSARP